MQHPPRFLADVHLGKLTRKLRMLGFDTSYDPQNTRTALLHEAFASGRILLSRSRSLERNPFVRTCILQSPYTDAQLQELNRQVNLSDSIRPFSRCLLCNALLEPAAKEKIAPQLQEQTLRDFEVFWQCSGCGHLYWEGSHHQRMLGEISHLLLQNGPG